MTHEPSRKTGPAAPLHSAGCPRCGLRQVESFKYCPNCAYRLVPQIVRTPAEKEEHATAGERIVALGGYLAVTSLLLLVVLAGIRLFTEEEISSAPAAMTVVIPRDPGALELTAESFEEITGGTPWWGRYGPSRRDEDSEEQRDAALHRALRELDAGRLDGASDEAPSETRGFVLPVPDGEVTNDLYHEFLLARARKTGEPTPERFYPASWARKSGRDLVKRTHESEEGDLPVAGIPSDAALEFSAWVLEEKLDEVRLALDEALVTAGGFDTPDPDHRLDDPFGIGRYEVTNDQYYGFLLARAKKSGQATPDPLYPALWTRKSGGALVDRIYEGGDGDLPVAAVPFEAALEFCAWVWEEKLGSDPDRIVDLPTFLEFIHAGRRDRASYNFPWGSAFDEPGAHAVLSERPLAVNDAKYVGCYEGVYALVGNVAEWVYDRDHRPVAAGWSFKRPEIRQRWYRDEWATTPFGEDGFEYVKGQWREDVGFRIVVRHAQAIPELVPVEAGPIRHRDYVNTVGVQPDVPEFPIEGEEDRLRVLTLAGSRTVPSDFAIARAETSNRQYLQFLVEASETRTTMETVALLPKEWNQLHPRADLKELLEGDDDHPGYGSLARVPQAEFARLGLRFEVFPGPFGDPRKIPFVYEAGQDNRPVQGISIEQAEAYAEWLSRKLGATFRVPTVAEYIRAGRGGGLAPYPWGDAEDSRELVCAGRTDSEDRSVSLLGRLSPRAPRIVGLVGNLLEYVRDEKDGKLLLAGGCFRFPANACTLDSFLDTSWEYVEWRTEAGVPADLASLGYHTGFRVARAGEP